MAYLLVFKYAAYANRFFRTRGEFRTAQLQAKRNAELAKRKERELLLSRSHTSEKKQPTEKFTQGDLVLNASNDVTSALRRTHQLMQAELSRSQFAQSTLGELPLPFSLILTESNIFLIRTIHSRDLISVRVL